MALMLVPYPTAAQDDFPRDVVDTTGQIVQLPARPQIVAMIGEVPALPLLVPDVRRIDSAPESWGAVGLLVVPESSGNPARIEAAEAAGVPVFRAASVTSLDGWRLLVERLGAALGREEAANRLLERLDDRLAWLGETVQDAPAVRVLILTPEGYTFGQGTLITELIAAAGGINGAAEAGYDDYRQITDSAIRNLAPDVILLSPAWTAPEISRFRATLDRAVRIVRLPFSPTMPDDPAVALVVLGFVLNPPLR